MDESYIEKYEGLTENEIKAIELLANKGNRNYTQIAKEIGITSRALYDIRNKPRVKELIRERIIDDMGEHLEDFKNIVVVKMKEGHYKFAELYAKTQGLLVDRSEVKNMTDNENSEFAKMTTEQLDAELKSLERELKLIEGGSK